MDNKVCIATTSKGEGSRTVRGRISTTAVDRDGDVLLPSGLDAAEFMRNPVVLFGHDKQSFPIGKVAGPLRKGRNDVQATVRFADRPPEHPPGAEWPADTVLSLFQQGVLNAFSVGFIVPPGGARPAGKKDVDRHGADCRQVITRWKMVELSVVPVPANQDALAMAVSKGLELGEWSLEAFGMDDVQHKVLTLDSEPRPFQMARSFRVAQ